MSELTFTTLAPVLCDAPCRSDLVQASDGSIGLRRTLDETYRSDPRARDAFEAEVGAALRSPSDPCVARILHAGVHPLPFIVREYAAGGTLADLLDERVPIGAATLLGFAEAALNGLDSIREAGFAHGDPSPSNLLVLENGRIALCDAWSSRRAWAESRSADRFSPSADLRILVAWLKRAAAGLDEADDGLARELRRALAGDAEDARRALGELARKRGPERPAPVELGPGPVDPPSPRPIAVELRVHGPAGTSAGYRLSRLVVERYGGELSRVRRDVERGTGRFRSTFPIPALVDAADLRRLGGDVEVVRAGEGRDSPWAPSTAGTALGLVPLVGLPRTVVRLTRSVTSLLSDPPPLVIVDVAVEVAVSAILAAGHVAIALTIPPLIGVLLVMGAWPGAR